MKIDKIIFASDDSHFLDFWPLQVKICKEVLDIEPVLFHITDEDSDFYNDGYGLVKKVKKVNGINTGAQAAIGRMFFTKYFPDEVCVVSDIDLLLINKGYIQGQIENFSKDSIVLYLSDAYDLNRPEVMEHIKRSDFPFVQEMYCYHYNAATGKTFNKVLGTDCTFEEYLKKHLEISSGKLFWCCDEFYFADCINHKNHNVEVHKLKRGYTSPWIVNKRIDRHRFPVSLHWTNEIKAQQEEGIYDFNNLIKDNIVDLNLPRPYSKFKYEIDNIVNIVLKNNKQNSKNYMENLKEKRIEELLKQPRMFFQNYEPRYNQLKGLKMLIDEFITPETTIVEVGSFAGISSELFALHCKEIYCVDMWDPYWEITDKQRIEFAEFSFDKMKNQYNNIHKVKNSSVGASELFEDKSLDFVYIDAAHDYNSVKEDLLVWLPKIKNGGYIGGHDYRYDSNIDVYQAVNDIFVENYKITSFPDSSFIIKL